MWVVLLFDMPANTKADKRNYLSFRKRLLQSGFSMFQFSVYIRHCMSREYAQKHIQRVKGFLPPKGHIVMFTITDKQFAMIEVYRGAKAEKPPPTGIQLELF